MNLQRRDFLKLTAFAPALPAFLARSAQAADSQSDRVLIVVRMIGGNDGLNSVIPVRDDAYYKGRPSIAIPRAKTIPLRGGDAGLHPALADFARLMDDGFGAILQNVGYANSSRSHSRSTEIWETGSTAQDLPREGWLGRYLDRLPSKQNPLTGLEFGETIGRTLTASSKSVRAAGNPNALLRRNLTETKTAPRSRTALDFVRSAQNELAQTTAHLKRASKGSGSRYAYPDTAFGDSLRWTGNMIEQGCPTRIFYITLGSFESGFSFDTHLSQLEAHESLYSQLGQGLRALATHLRAVGALDRVQLLTFSDFGRQTIENNQGGTDHGDAGVLFAMGGRVKAGLHGAPPDIAGAYDGGLKSEVDFRRIYAAVLRDWLTVDPKLVLDRVFEPYPLFQS